MRVLWCLEPLTRSSLVVQSTGCAGRAATTCSPFFTLILGEGARAQGWNLHLLSSQISWPSTQGH